MAAKSAKNGTVSFGATPTAIAEITDIQINETTEEQAFNSSSTAGERRRVAGVSDVTGSFRLLSDDVPSGVEDGVTVRLVITSDGSVTMFDDDAYIVSVAYGVPVNGGGLIEATITFARNG